MARNATKDNNMNETLTACQTATLKSPKWERASKVKLKRWEAGGYKVYLGDVEVGWVETLERAGVWDRKGWKFSNDEGMSFELDTKRDVVAHLSKAKTIKALKHQIGLDLYLKQMSADHAANNYRGLGRGYTNQWQSYWDDRHQY